MSFLDNMRIRIAEAIGGDPLRESSIGTPILDEFADPDENQFRSISEGVLRRDITSLKRERILKIVYTLYLAYPLAHRALEIKQDMVVGDGLSFKAEDPDVQELLESFWNDPTNDMENKQRTRVLELSLFGEQFLPVFVDPNNGHVHLGYIDPLQVKRVIVNPVNVEQAMAIQFVTGKKKKTLSVINIDRRAESKSFGLLSGEVFFFAINKVSNATRGNSDLMPVADWLELHEQFLMGIHEAAHLKTGPVWDVLVEGATDQQLKEIRKKQGNIKRGVTRYHNEKVTTTAIVPDLGTAELAEHAAVLKRHIAAGLGLPEHWLAETGSNRATAAEAGLPATKMLRARQKVFVGMISKIFNFVIDQAILHGKLDREVDKKFTIMAQQIWPTDTQRITSSLVTGAQAFMLAEQNEWIGPEAASEAFNLIADQLGMVLPRGKRELERIEKINKRGTFDEVHEDAIAALGQKFSDGIRGKLPGEGLDGVDIPRDVVGDAPAQMGTMNGVQITAVSNLVMNVANNKLPSNVAMELISAAFPNLSRDMIKKMLDEARAHETPQ